MKSMHGAMMNFWYVEFFLRVLYQAFYFPFSPLH